MFGTPLEAFSEIPLFLYALYPFTIPLLPYVCNLDSPGSGVYTVCNVNAIDSPVRGILFVGNRRRVRAFLKHLYCTHLITLVMYGLSGNVFPSINYFITSWSTTIEEWYDRMD